MADLVAGTVHDRHSIAETLGIEVAAADRYIRQIKDVPGVVAFHEGKRLAIRFEFGEAVPRPSHPAAVAACWASGVAEIFAGSDYEKGVRDALAYVTGRARRSTEFRHVDRKFIFVSRGGESSLPDSAEHLDELVDAVLRSRCVDLTYVHFAGDEEGVRIRPLSMAIYDHQIYVIGVPSAGGAPYPYRLSRVRSAEITKESFQYPERSTYDPKQLFRDSFGIFISDSNPVARVRVRLGKRWRLHCRTHRWHPSQRIEDVPEGIIVTVVARVCWELKAWILGFGADAVVLEPPELAAEIGGIAIKMAAAYGGLVEGRAGPRRATAGRAPRNRKTS